MLQTGGMAHGQEVGVGSSIPQQWLHPPPYLREEDEPFSARYFAAMTLGDTLVAL
jgi:hypothetical protein